LDQQKDLNINQRNKMTNTEKPSTKAQKIKETGKMISKKVETTKKIEKPPTEKNIEKEKVEEKKEQKPIVKKEKIKKTIAVVNAKSIPMSTKHAIAICKFIKKKRIGDAIRNLEEVILLKKAVPMKGEIPHRKGKISSGRFPQRAAKNFITILKGLAGNASEMDDPIIAEAIANFASRPVGRFGRVKNKRTHVKLVAKEKKLIKLNKKQEKKNGRK